MSEGHDDGKPRPEDRNITSDKGIDAKVLGALSAAEWIAGWAADAMSVEGFAPEGRLSVGWIRIVQPSERLLSSLQRLERVHGQDGRWHLMLDSPIFAPLVVLHRWSTTAMSVLRAALGDEASFLAVMVLGEVPNER
jgi:hypothetical protein